MLFTPSDNSSQHFHIIAMHTSTAIFISNIFILPLYICVFVVSHQRWKKCQSASHSDICTIHVCVMEVLAFFGLLLHVCAIHMRVLHLDPYGNFIIALMAPGTTLLHLLTCVERYFAVVHPVTYHQSLKQIVGVKIRNVSIGCIWLLCLWLACLFKVFWVYTYFSLVLLAISLILVSFCSFSILVVLMRPRPSGDVSNNSCQVDRKKRRAFIIVMLIDGVLLLRFMCAMITQVFYLKYPAIHAHVLMWCLVWLNVPSMLLLPLVFLHRAGRLPTCKLIT